eukprot:jgi/Tetstr1/428801/TSEL_018788.t1
MYLLASLAACVSISVDGMTAVRNVWIKLGAQEWGDKNSTDHLNEAIEAHAPDYHPLLADTDIKMDSLGRRNSDIRQIGRTFRSVVGNGNWVQKGSWPSIIALLFRSEERLGKQRDYDLKSKQTEEPVRSAETASHVETIEALKAMATFRDFPTDMRSLSHRLLDTPVYDVSYSRAGLGLTM